MGDSTSSEMEVTSHDPVSRASVLAWSGMNDGNFELLTVMEISEDCFSLHLLWAQNRCFEHMYHSKVLKLNYILMDVNIHFQLQ